MLFLFASGIQRLVFANNHGRDKADSFVIINMIVLFVLDKESSYLFSFCRDDEQRHRHGYKFRVAHQVFLFFRIRDCFDLLDIQAYHNLRPKQNLLLNFLAIYK